jgi:hypothetical protein
MAYPHLKLHVAAGTLAVIYIHPSSYMTAERERETLVAVNEAIVAVFQIGDH